MTYLCLVLTLICLTKCVYAKLECEAKVDLDFLNTMIDAQLLTSSCEIEVKLMEGKNMSNYCYKKGVMIALQTFFSYLKFKNGSESFNKIEQLEELYHTRCNRCMKDRMEDIQLHDISACLRPANRSTVQILEIFKTYFAIFIDFKPIEKYDEKCWDFYDKCFIEDASLTKEQYSDGRERKHRHSDLYLVMFPSLLAVVLLCLLLYYVYRYRLLKRHLNREHAMPLPEQRPLHIELQEV